MDTAFGLKISVHKHLPLGYIHTKNELKTQSHWAVKCRFVLNWVKTLKNVVRPPLVCYYGMPFVSKFRILWTWNKILVFMKLTGIYDRIAIYILVFTHYTGIYTPYWYLRAILVLTHHTGIYTLYWYLCTILVFTHDTGSYVRYRYLRAILIFMNDTGIYKWYWYLHAILVFTRDTGIYTRY